jgi:putative membrane protein
MRTNWAKNVVRASTAIAVLAIPAVALAQQQSSRGGGWGELDAKHLAGGVLATFVYGLVGILLVIVGFKAFSAVLPFSVKKELEEDHNLSVGVLLAALVLGICIVVAATIHS